MAKQKRKADRPNCFEVRLPASSSNLGPGFDCFGLALKLYLRIRATPLAKSSVACRVRTTGARENAALPRNATNLIYRAMAFAAWRESLTLPHVDLAVHNEIPLASGLGSSAAAIVGGIKLCGMLCDSEIPRSEEHTSELQSLRHLVCRLLLEKKKNTQRNSPRYRETNRVTRSHTI